MKLTPLLIKKNTCEKNVNYILLFDYWKVFKKNLKNIKKISTPVLGLLLKFVNYRSNSGKATRII